MTDTIPDLTEKHSIGKETREWIVGPAAKPALSIYGIVLAGISDALPGFSFARNNPSMSQILVCADGAGMVLVDRQWASCGIGSAYLTPLGAVHGYYANNTKPWRVCWVCYGGSPKADSVFGVREPTLLSLDSEPLLSSIRFLYKEAQGAADLVVMQHWTFLIDTYCKRGIEPASRLKELWDTVRLDVNHSWSIGELASIAGMSAEHLRRICLHEVRTSPMRYVAELRMREAAALLSSANYTIDEVAERIGYSNAYAFSTSFKRHMGVTPSAYRSTSR